MRSVNKRSLFCRTKQHSASAENCRALVRKLAAVYRAGARSHPIGSRGYKEYRPDSKRHALCSMDVGGATKRTTMSESKFHSNEAGFTLVELAIVGAIISIAAALSVPSFNQMYAKHELYQATTSLYNRLILARASAISRNIMIAATPVSAPMGHDTVAF